MDFLFELIFDLIAEGTLELSKSVKVPKYIRYPLIAIIVLFSVAVISVILLVGIASFKENVVLGTVFVAIAVLMTIMGIKKFRQTYLERKNK